MCDLPKIWDICCSAMVASYTEYNVQTVKELTELTVPSFRDEFYKFFIGSKLMIMKMANLALEIKGVDEKKLQAYTDKLVQVLDYVLKNYETSPPPKDIFKMRFLLLCTRITILRDRWHQNDFKTYRRGPVLKYIPTMFYLEMLLRLWERREAILPETSVSTPEEGCLPIYFTLKDFGLVKFMKNADPETTATSNTTVRNWLPIKLHRVTNLLAKGYQEGWLELDTKQKRNMAFRLRDAISDRAALLCCLTQKGSSIELGVDNPDWFVNIAQTQKILEAETFKTDTSYQSLSKQVAEHMKKETEKMMKQHFADEELTAVKTQLETKDNILAIVEANKEELTIQELKGELGRLEDKQRMLEESVAEGVTEDFTEEDLNEEKNELEVVKRNIAKIHSLIETIKTQVINDMKDKNEANLTKLDDILHGRKKLSNVESQASNVFIRDTMLKLDQLMIWQIPSGRQIDRFNIDSVLFAQELKQKIFDAATKATQVEFLGQAQDYILHHTVTFSEREYYRSVRSADDTFSFLDVCSVVRGPNEKIISDFPTSLKELITNPENKYHRRFVDFTLQWWIGQSLSKKNINQTIFFYDADLEFLSFNRTKLQNPVISRISGKWCIILPESWEYQDSINALWGEDSLLEIMYEWCVMMDAKQWKLHNFTTKDSYDYIHNTDLCKFFKTFSKRGVKS